MPKPTTFAPASGIPARGAGKGDGWGGPAKGAGSQRKPFDGTTRPPPDTFSPEKQAARCLLAAAEEERQRQMREVIGDLALNAEREETQLSAAVAYLNRSEGMPQATNKNFNAEVTFEQLVKQSLKPKVE